MTNQQLCKLWIIKIKGRKLRVEIEKWEFELGLRKVTQLADALTGIDDTMAAALKEVASDLRRAKGV